jgi:hypothetical protein
VSCQHPTTRSTEHLSGSGGLTGGEGGALAPVLHVGTSTIFVTGPHKRAKPKVFAKFSLEETEVPTIMMRRTVPLLLALSAVVTVAATEAAEHALAASKNITGGARPTWHLVGFCLLRARPHDRDPRECGGRSGTPQWVGSRMMHAPRRAEFP